MLDKKELAKMKKKQETKTTAKKSEKLILPKSQFSGEQLAMIQSETPQQTTEQQQLQTQQTIQPSSPDLLPQLTRFTIVEWPDKAEVCKFLGKVFANLPAGKYTFGLSDSVMQQFNVMGSVLARTEEEQAIYKAMKQ